MANYGTKGTQLQIVINSSNHIVGQLKSLDGPPVTMGTRDVTHLGSTIKNYEASIGDPGELKGQVIYDSLSTAPNDGARYLETRVSTPSTVNGGDTFRIVLPTTTLLWSFQGIVTEFSPKGGDVEGTWMADFGIRASRAITNPTS